MHKPSKRRALVVARRIQRGEDVLQRPAKRYRWPKRPPKWIRDFERRRSSHPLIIYWQAEGTKQ